MKRIGLGILFTMLLCGCKYSTYSKFEEKEYDKLEDMLHQRKKQLINYLTDTKKLADKAKKDEVLLSFFKAKKDYYYLSRDTVIPDDIIQGIEKLKQNIQYYYLINYLNFYDIMFIDTTGEVFYTIKKQGNYHKNIFKDNLSDSTLSGKLKNYPAESFVDFQFYKVSGEPSAFFIEPVIENHQTTGWIVLQCSINKIDNLFSSDKNIGLTGEVILVNKDHYLLTNSRFKAEPTILKQKLPYKNIESKFKEKKGRKSVIDYRGNTVISAFEVFEFLNKEWLIIAKIDKSEVITQYYLNNEKKLYGKIENKVRNYPVNNEKGLFNNPENVQNVDMDEFIRGDSSSVLFTRGVSSCTGLTVKYPGKFSYMAHISPNDMIYGMNRTDLVNIMFQHIFYFEITKSESQNLEFFIMSTQSVSFKDLIHIILANGCFLSQIKIMCKPQMIYGNMYSFNNKDINFVSWKKDEYNGENINCNFKDISTVEDLVLLN